MHLKVEKAQGEASGSDAAQSTCTRWLSPRAATRGHGGPGEARPILRGDAYLNRACNKLITEPRE